MKKALAIVMVIVIASLLCNGLKVVGVITSRLGLKTQGASATSTGPTPVAAARLVVDRPRGSSVSVAPSPVAAPAKDTSWQEPELKKPLPSAAPTILANPRYSASWRKRDVQQLMTMIAQEQKLNTGPDTDQKRAALADLAAKRQALYKEIAHDNDHNNH